MYVIYIRKIHVAMGGGRGRLRVRQWIGGYAGIAVRADDDPGFILPFRLFFPVEKQKYGYIVVRVTENRTK